MRPSFGVNFLVDRSDFTARGPSFKGVLGSDLILGSRLAGRAVVLMGALGSDLIPGPRFTAGSRFMAVSFLRV